MQPVRTVVDTNQVYSSILCQHLIILTNTLIINLTPDNNGARITVLTFRHLEQLDLRVESFTFFFHNKNHMISVNTTNIHK
jgi:hypothetical protein